MNRDERLMVGEQIREQIESIYDAMAEIRELLRDLPEELNRADSYWLAHIDMALENRGGYLGGSFIKAEDTLQYILEDVEGCPVCERIWPECICGEGK